MAKLNIGWTELASTSVTTGTTGGGALQDFSTARGMLRADDAQEAKPILVYLTSSDEKDLVAQDVIDQTTMKDERVSLASKMFTMVKADGNQISSDHPFAKWIGGKDLPRIVLFSSVGEEVGKLEGRASPSKLFALMKKAAARDFKTNVDRFVKDYQKILTELDKISALQQAAATKEARDISASEQRKLEKKKQELAKNEEELRALEEKLLEFERRTAT